MEYAVPLEATIDCLGEVRKWIDSTGNPTMFPVEVRAAAGDDIALSPAYGRPTGYIAVHVFRGTPHERYFHAVEAVMAAHGGRPHWGKLHCRTADDLAPAYPMWEQFQSVRRSLDPAGVFQNAYANRVLGRF
jgi:FAD/FMN-containing dehydrogenase